jgi:hypothetical protein
MESIKEGGMGRTERGGYGKEEGHTVEVSTKMVDRPLPPGRIPSPFPPCSCLSVSLHSLSRHEIR